MAKTRIDVALEEVIGRTAHDRDGDELRHERRCAKKAGNPGFNAGVEIGAHDHGDERPRHIGPDEKGRAKCEPPTDLLGGELWFLGGDDCLPRERACR